MAVEGGLWLLAVGVLVALWTWMHRRSRGRLYQLAERLPGPPGLPVIGNLLEFLGGPDKVFTNLYSKTFQYENVIKLWAGPRLLVFLSHPDDIELILSSHVHIDKSSEYRLFQPWLGNGLLISSGETWRAHRKLIAPAFHLSVLRRFLGLFNENSKAVVERLRREATSGTIDCHDYMSEATVEILLETAMGVSKETQDRGYEYAMAVMKMCDILHLRHTKLWMRPDFLFAWTKYASLQNRLLSVIHGLTRKVLKIRKEALTEGGVLEDNHEEMVEETEEEVRGLKDDLDTQQNVGEKKRLAFLDLLIESSQQGTLFSDEEIQNQVDTIMFEGHDTTAACSSFFLCVLAARPDIQEKCFQEMTKIFGDSDRPVTFQDTLEMKYLERCIMETLRLYPPVPIIARELNEELKLASRELTIPAKCTVIVATYKLHRRSDIYPQPDVFNPDHFLPENSASRHYYSFIPFSAGPRSCVGRKYAMLKLKVLLSTIIRNFQLLGGSPEKDWVLQADIILKRTDGFKVRLQPRHKITS